MTEPEVEGMLFPIIWSVLGDKSVNLSATTTAKDVPGWDSLKQVMIIVGVEEKFGIRLASREIDQLHCVGDFVALISAKTGKTAGC
jgi:acyl carrier protein